jgi:hypothetical protein
VEKTHYYKVAEAILYLKNKNKYINVAKGNFKNVPEFEGHYINLSKIFGTETYLLLNKNKDYKPSVKVKLLAGKLFLLSNINDLDSFINGLNKYLVEFVKLVNKGVTLVNKEEDEVPDKGDGEGDYTKYNLPYGYSKYNGEIVVDKEEANVTKKVFSNYIRLKSMSKVAEQLSNSGEKQRSGDRLDYATISNILHDTRYMDLKPNIIPPSIFKRAQVILQRNTSQEKRISL